MQAERQRGTRSTPTICGALVCAGVALAALVHSRPSGTSPILHPLAAEATRSFYVAAAYAEEEARATAEGRFRGSAWSRDDEFHSQEARWLRAEAARYHATVATTVDTLDRGMHEHWPTGDAPPPSQTVLPCRPRLNY